MIGTVLALLATNVFMPLGTAVAALAGPLAGFVAALGTLIFAL